MTIIGTIPRKVMFIGYPKDGEVVNKVVEVQGNGVEIETPSPDRFTSRESIIDAINENPMSLVAVPLEEHSISAADIQTIQRATKNPFMIVHINKVIRYYNVGKDRLTYTHEEMLSFKERFISAGS